MLIVILIISIISVLSSLIALRKIARENDERKYDHQEKEEKFVEKIEKNFSKNREENSFLARQNREEINNYFKNFNDSIEKKLEQIRITVENKLHFLQEENNKKLEQMRATVDEKLQATIEKRFDQSFKLISEQLTQVHKGLGEMQNLASGVGDLKKVLSNVKTRGNIGEIQLAAILEQFLSNNQYEKNFATKESSQQRVEFAIKIPSKEEENKSIFLPIDSKFPLEDYQRLLDAYENLDQTNQQFSKTNIDSAKRQFEMSVKKAAKDICDKYLNPPLTTDFAIMFVPTEALYSKILESENLFEELQKNYHVIVLGPTVIVAFLNALQMGFRTLAIEKKSSEVWKTLGSVKNEFGKFGILLDKAKKKIQEAGNTLDDVAVRSRAVERRLKDVVNLPEENNEQENIEYK